MNKRSAVAGGILLILFGVLSLARQLFPEVFDFISWPFYIIGLGLIFLFTAILSRSGGFAIPGFILVGLGAIFYFQESSLGYASWSYMWALIPGFVGLGLIFSGLIDRNVRGAAGGGLTLMLISLVLFFLFGGSFGLDPQIVQYWPVILIGLGLVMLLRLMFGRK